MIRYVSKGSELAVGRGREGGRTTSADRGVIENIGYLFEGDTLKLEREKGGETDRCGGDSDFGEKSLQRSTVSQEFHSLFEILRCSG